MRTGLSRPPKLGFDAMKTTLMATAVLIISTLTYAYAGQVQTREFHDKQVYSQIPSNNAPWLAALMSDGHFETVLLCIMSDTGVECTRAR